jgi:hypothetical protein
VAAKKAPTVQRFDFAAARSWQITTQGFLRTDATLKRVGVLVYELGGGQVRRELCLPEEVFAPAAMETLGGAPLTLRHPPLTDALITPDNYRQYAIGFTGDVVKQDAAAGHVDGSVTVQDGPAIKKAQARELVELSPGYVCRLDMSPGVHEKYGAYDCIQRTILHNHVGLGPRGWGRSGSDVSLRLDGASEDIGLMRLGAHSALAKFAAERANEIGLDVTADDLVRLVLDGWLPSPTEEQMVALARALDTDHDALIRLNTDGRSKKPTSNPRESKRMETIEIRIDGIEYEVSKAVAPHISKAIADRDATITAHNATIAKLTADQSALQARFDGATEEVGTLKTQLAEAPVKLRAQIQSRMTLEQQARDVLGAELKLDGADGKPKTDRQLQEEMLRKLKPSINLDGKDDAYVASRLDAAMEDGAQGDASQRALGTSVPAGGKKPEKQIRQDGSEELDPDEERAAMIKRQAERK